MLDFVRWLVPGRVMLVQFSGVLMRDDVIRMNTQAMALMEEALPLHINVIVDSALVTTFASEIMNVRGLQSILGKHPLVNWHIIVNPDPNPAMRFIGSMVFTLMGARLRISPTVDSAMEFLQAWEAEHLTQREAAD